MKTLYVTDLDGTLLRNDESLSDYSKNIFNELIQKDIMITYATARSLESASIVTKGIDFKFPVVIYNGGFIKNPRTDEIIVGNYYSREEILYLGELFKELNLSPLVYTIHKDNEKVYYIDDKTNVGFNHYLNSRNGSKRFEKKECLDALLVGNIFYFTLINTKEHLLKLYNKINEDNRFYSLFHLESYTNAYWLEIMPIQTNKANALMKLKEILNCDQIVCFGDSINDIPMFNLSNTKLAVSNANTELKKLATHIILSNEEDGVASWLKDNVLNKGKHKC